MKLLWQNLKTIVLTTWPTNRTQRTAGFLRLVFGLHDARAELVLVHVVGAGQGRGAEGGVRAASNGTAGTWSTRSHKIQLTHLIVGSDSDIFRLFRLICDLVVPPRAGAYREGEDQGGRGGWPLCQARKALQRHRGRTRGR